MGGTPEQRWDDEVEAAWTAYRSALGDALAALEQEATLAIELPLEPDDPDDRVAPYCQALAWGGHVLTVEAVSDAFLLPGDAIGPDGEARLLTLGFERPSGEDAPHFGVTLDVRDADRVAWMMATAMREVYGVVHPAFLAEGPEVVPPVPPADDEVPAPAAARDAHWPPADAGPWFPADTEAVRRAVHRVVRDLVDDEPTWDADDDLPILTEHARVWVVVAEALPRVLLTCTLLTEVADEARALVEANLLNRRHVGLSFLLDDRRLVVRRELGVSAFQPSEVRAELARLLEHVDRWVPELRERVGGRGAHDERVSTPLAVRGAREQGDGADHGDASARRFEAAYAVMRELEREDRGATDPSTLARVFHHDRDLVMRAVAATRAREQEARRRAAGHEEAERPAAARRYRAAARYRRGLRSRLRRALRITVQSGRRPETHEQLTLFAEEDARS